MAGPRRPSWLARFTALDAVTRGWAVMTAGSVLRLALGLIASILIARALGPEAFGAYAVLAGVAGIVGAGADFGLTPAAVKGIAATRARAPALAQLRARVYVWLRAGTVGLVTLAGMLLAGPLSELLHLPDGDLLLRLALLGVLASALSGAMTTLLQANDRFAALSLVLIVNSGLTAVLAAGLAALGWLNLITALVVLGIGASLASLLVGRLLLPEGWLLHFPGGAAMRSEGRTLLGFGRWLWLAGLFAVLTAQLDVLLVNRLTTLATAGVYALALNLANKAAVVNHSLNTVLLPAASALQRGGDYRGYLRRGLLRSALISLALLSLLPLARPLIVTLYGAAFAGAAPLFRWLLLAVVIDVMLTPLLMLAYPLERPQVLAAAEASRATTLAGLTWWLVPLLGPMGAVAARFAAKFGGALLTLLLLRRELAARLSAPVE